MDLSDLQQSLETLVNEASSLAMDSVDGRGEFEARLARAKALEQKLDELRQEIDAAPAEERRQLERAWLTAQSHLQVVAAIAPAPPENTLLGRVREINAKAFALAKDCAAGQQDLQILVQQANGLHQEMISLVGQPGHSAPEAQNLLGEANLDILYVLSGGKAPSSLRLHHFRTQ